MTIKVGDKMPSVTLRQVTPEGPKEVATDEFLPWQESRAVRGAGCLYSGLLAAPSAGLCRQGGRHQGEGIDEVACVAVNDAAVMGAWGKDQKTGGKVTMLADGSGDFVRALGLELDLSKGGLGVRSKRYSMLVDNGVVKSLNVEAQPGQVDASSAEAMLKALV